MSRIFYLRIDPRELFVLPLGGIAYDTKARWCCSLHQCLHLLSFSQMKTRRSTLLGEKRKPNGSNMGEPIRTRKEKLAGKVEHDARLGRVVQVKERGGGNPLM